MTKHGNTFGSAQSVFPSALKRLAAGYTDETLVTVRKMAAAGATAEEIGTACGRSTAWARNYIYRNNLVWNRMRGDPVRHIMSSAGSIAGHMRMGHAAWADEGVKLRQQGWTTKRIAEKVGVSPAGINQYFRRHGIKPLVPVKRRRMANRAKMLELIIQLHVETVLSEGQVAKATGLDRPEIRRLVDEATNQQVAA